MRYCGPDMDIKWIVTIIAILVTTQCCNLQSSVSFSNFNFLLFNHIYHDCGLRAGRRVWPGVIIRQDCRGPVPLSWEPGRCEDMTMLLQLLTGCCVCLQDCIVPASSPAPSGWEERRHL